MSSRLTSLSVENFRSIRGRIDVDLDAPVVLVHGANGSGKTSLLSALELGLTGGVNSLQRSKTEDANNLIHVGAKQATVVVGSNDAQIETGLSEVIVNSNGISGQPLLTENQARFYNERCFLAQSVLGRLLEIYEGDDARSDSSPLTRFVQELLGLDVLDNIVDGLHHLKHVKRLRKSIPVFEDVEDQRAKVSDRLKAIEVLVSEHSQEHSKLETELREALSSFEVDEQLNLNEAAEIITNQDDGNKKSEQLSVLKREVTAAQSLLSNLPPVLNTAMIEEAEHALQIVQASLEKWRASHEKNLLETLLAASKIFPNLPGAAVVGYETAHADTTEAVSKEHQRKGRRLEEDRANSDRLKQSREIIQKSTTRLERLDTRLVELTKGSGDLAATLSEITQHIDDDRCPVCDRDFSEVSETPLRAHLASHISSLTRMANELQEVTLERRSENALREENERLVQDLSNRVLPENSRNSLTTEIARLAELSQSLAATSSSALEGEGLARDEKSALLKLSTFRQNQESLRGLRASAEEFPNQLDLKNSPPGETLSQTLERCIDAIALQQNAISLEQVARRRVTSAVFSLRECKEHGISLRSELKEMTEEKSRMDIAWAKAEKTREIAKCLSDKAVTVRTNIVRRVFNDSLNEVWKDLFIRLAPDERFIPAFAFPTPGSGPVTASLETVFRGESRRGNPRSMLSAGNLNTAALTLFLSLHLSVKPVLPWLIIDDPVQSMDEIHIAQFAALLRTLSRQRERQTIIAVHEKPLFDYLALELSPAHEGDRLVTIELSRGYDRNTECQYEMRTWDPNSVFRAPVAV